MNEFDILSSIWIFACNDENSIITYQGIIYRLGIENEYDVEKAKKLVLKRGDLFRRKIPQNRLEQWREEMNQGRRIPTWISEKNPLEQQRIITSLTTDDVFRSQFRAEPNAQRSSIEILNWGLQHIDRLRLSTNTKRENTFKTISLLVIPVLSLLITLITVVNNNYTQLKMKKYEVTFKIKQDIYSKFMQNVYDTFEGVRKYQVNNLGENIDQLKFSYFNIEPFLNESERKYVWNEYQNFTSICINYQNKMQSADFEQKEVFVPKYLDSLIICKENFHKVLYPALFENDK
jgi:hypothetical protein